MQHRREEAAPLDVWVARSLAPHGLLEDEHVAHTANMTARVPGDLLLDRYLSGADEKARERARDGFAELARLLEALGEEVGTADSRETKA